MEPRELKQQWLSYTPVPDPEQPTRANLARVIAASHTYPKVVEEAIPTIGDFWAADMILHRFNVKEK